LFSTAEKVLANDEKSQMMTAASAAKIKAYVVVLSLEYFFKTNFQIML